MNEQPASDYSATRSGTFNIVPAVGLVVHEPEEAYRPPGKPRLLDQVRAAIRTRHYSHRTEKRTPRLPAHPEPVEGCILFHRKRHPAEMGKAEVSSFLSSLATEAHVDRL